MRRGLSLRPRTASGRLTDLLGHLSDAAREKVWEDSAAAWEIVEQIIALHDHTAGNLNDLKQAWRSILSNFASEPSG